MASLKTLNIGEKIYAKDAAVYDNNYCWATEDLSTYLGKYKTTSDTGSVVSTKTTVNFENGEVSGGVKSDAYGDSPGKKIVMVACKSGDNSLEIIELKRTITTLEESLREARAKLAVLESSGGGKAVGGSRRQRKLRKNRPTRRSR